MKRLNKRLNKRAFTLLETIIVCTIAVVIGVAVTVAVSDYIDSAKKAAEQIGRRNDELLMLLEDEGEDNSCVKYTVIYLDPEE